MVTGEDWTRLLKNTLFHKNVLRGCIRVRGLHLVLPCFNQHFIPQSSMIHSCTTLYDHTTDEIKMNQRWDFSKIRPPFWGAEIEMPSGSIGTQMT